MLERLLDEVSFDASDAGRSRDEVRSTPRTSAAACASVVEDEDLSRYIL